MLKDGFTSPADLVHEINNLIESQKYEDAYKLVLGHLPDSRFQSSDVYYVCSRLCLSIADTHSRSNREQYEFYINSGYRFAKTGYSLDENHPGCAKYLAILLEKQLWIKGKRKWIEASITLREHLLKSLSLEPTDSLVCIKWDYGVLK
ncbi:unnamed protein product [Heterobilharzia americana]|nr:unnamed protein product [Heterobilharzia americana]